MDKKAPKGLLLNRTELAHSQGMAASTIDNYLVQGMPVFKKSEGRGRSAQFDTAVCGQWFRENKCQSGPEYLQL